MTSIRSDLSGERLIREDRVTSVPKCYTCQREAKRKTVTHYSTHAYQGPEEIKKETPVTDENGRVSYITEVFTGHYVMKFGNFCSVKCGLNWANSELNRRRIHRLEQKQAKAQRVGEGWSSENQAKLQQFKEAQKGKRYG